MRHILEVTGHEPRKNSWFGAELDDVLVGSRCYSRSGALDRLVLSEACQSSFRHVDIGMDPNSLFLGIDDFGDALNHNWSIV